LTEKKINEFIDIAHYNSIMSNINKYWHPANTGEPKDYKLGSNKKLLWQCPIAKDHQWITTVSKISAGGGCPFCCGRKIAKSNCLATTHPDLSKEWHPIKNEITPFDVGYGQGKKVWWQCEKGHEWQCTVNNRTNFNSGCPFCLNQKVSIENSILFTHPDIAKEWHEKNEIQIQEICSGCNKKVWWKCKENHEWEASVVNRCGKGRRGCPYCKNKKISSTNSLFAKYPDLCKEWHPNKNGIVLPSMIFPGTARKVWWQCKKGHEWEMSVYCRTGFRKAGCPICNESKGEARVAKYLDEMKIEYERQATFTECRNKLVLRFDFAILPDRRILIEYNGKQHYKANSHFGGEQALQDIQRNDKIKVNFCNKNNLKLLLISYRDFNQIEAILESELNG
jgi:hypothetical protein